MRILNVFASMAIVSSLAAFAVINTSCVNNTVVGDIECDGNTKEVEASYNDPITLTAKIDHGKGLAHLKCGFGENLRSIDGSTSTEIENGVATFSVWSKPFDPFTLHLYVENHDKVSTNQIVVTFNPDGDQFSFTSMNALQGMDTPISTSTSMSAQEAEHEWRGLDTEQQVVDVLWGFLTSSGFNNFSGNAHDIYLSITQIIVQDFSFQEGRQFYIDGISVTADILTKCSIKLVGSIRIPIGIMHATLINPVLTIQNLLINSGFSKEDGQYPLYNLLPSTFDWSNKYDLDRSICNSLSTVISFKDYSMSWIVNRKIYSTLFDYDSVAFQSYYFKNVSNIT